MTPTEKRLLIVLGELGLKQVRVDIANYTKVMRLGDELSPPVIKMREFESTIVECLMEFREEMEKKHVIVDGAKQPGEPPSMGEDGTGKVGNNDG